MSERYGVLGRKSEPVHSAPPAVKAMLDQRCYGGLGWGSDLAPYSMRILEATGIPGFNILHYTYAYMRSV